MGFWTSKRQAIFGWSFLLFYSALAAWLNQPGAEAAGSEPADPALWQLVLGWTAISMLYAPAYALLILTVRKFDWTLSEWGFGLARRSWLAIGPAVAFVAYLWIQGVLRSGAAPCGQWATLSMGAFEGYARVGEELIYRGFAIVFLMKNLPAGRGRAFWAVVIAGALFALMHTHQEPARRLNLFLAGALPLGALTLWTRSLSLAFVLHGLDGGGAVGATVGLLFFAAMVLIERRRSARSKAEVRDRIPPPRE